MQNNLISKRLSLWTRFIRHYKSGKISQNGSCIDLRSDTVTRPTKGMLEVMMQAKLGDDVYKEDPTVNELEERCGSLFGMENALFVPSGTMGNLLAIMSHCFKRGEELIIGSSQHVYMYEQGNFVQLASIPACVLPNQIDGTMLISDIEKNIKDDSDFHQSETKLICLENTHMKAGGLALPRKYMNDVTQLAKSCNLKIHVDGARLYNSAVALDEPVCKLLEGVDSVSMCLSKGLGCPVGSVIGGSNAFIERAKRLRKPLGGGLRQSGILAAAGLYALDRAESILQDDHLKAKHLAEGIDAMGNENFQVKLENVQTNIVFVSTPKDLAPKIVEGLALSNVLCQEFDNSTIRFVTHLDVTHEDIEKTLLYLQSLVL